jgi:hypothetical protein
MTPTQYRAALKAASLSQERWADCIGIGRRTSLGYALGESPVHPAVEILLRLLVKGRITVEDVEDVK